MLPSPVTITDPVGPAEIARRLGVDPLTPHQWRRRGILPLAAFVVSRTPVWDWPTIEAWARETGRLARPLPAPVPSGDPEDYARRILSKGSTWR